MPTTARLRTLLAAAAVALLPVVALAAPGTAGAGPRTAEASPSPSTCPLINPRCLAPRPTVTPVPTEEPSESATPSTAPSPSATPPPPPRRTSSPRPRSTGTPSSGSTEDPVTGTVDIGGVAGTSEEPAAAPDTEDSSSRSGPGSHLTRLLVLVLGGAVLLGVGGAAGLYLTRHHG